MTAPPPPPSRQGVRMPPKYRPSDWDLEEEDEEESRPAAGERLAVDESIAADSPAPAPTSPRACVLPACESRPVDDKTWRERERDRNCRVSDFPNIKINELIDVGDLWL